MWFWPWLRLARPDPILRPAIMADCTRLAAIHAEGFAVGWDREVLERMLLEGYLADVIVSAGVFGQIVTGFALSRVVLDEAELMSVALDPEVRGQGFSARLLMRHAERLSRAGARALFLEVAAENSPALALYRRLGFVEIGRRTAYYAAQHGGDALTMRWDLSTFDPTPRPF